MTIDVAISSCARPDVLEPSVQSFLKHIVSEHDFRLVLVEDQVEDAKRQAIGHAWLEANKHLFDQLVYASKRLTYVYCFSEIMHYLSSPVFFRLEDDVLFTESLHIDPLIAHLESQPALAQLVFARNKHNVVPPKGSVPSHVNGHELLPNDFYSIATGLFKLDWTQRIVNHSGTGQCHESGVLTPAMRTLGAQSAVVLGTQNRQCYRHVGDDLGYVKGSWQNS